jgi:putative DNA primase/helicase
MPDSLDNSTNTESQGTVTLGTFADQQRVWCAWRSERDGDRVTKRPYQSRAAFANHADSQSWITINRAAEIAGTEGWLPPEGGGIGIFLGLDCSDGYCLAGLDLDGCVVAGRMAEWGQLIIDRFDTYTEISPSGTGAKLWFKYRRADLDEIRELIGGAQWGKVVKQRREDEQDHAPGFELHLGRRFFAVTHQLYPDAPEEINWVSTEDLRWLLDEIPPLFKTVPAADVGDVGSCSFEPDVSGVSEKPWDESHSGRAFSRLLHLWRTGQVHTYDEAKTVLLADDPGAGIKAWTLEKGAARGERELRRAWGGAALPKSFIASQMDDMAATFAAELDEPDESEGEPDDTCGAADEPSAPSAPA